MNWAEGSLVKTAIFPGSFNPWHKAHEHVLKQALVVFDKVYVARGINGNKPKSDTELPRVELLKTFGSRVEVIEFNGLLADIARELKVNAVVRGLRNVFDFYEEKDNQYWHEDLGLTVPIFYVITRRDLGHISSKAIRIVDGIK
jgi:pantetheine-phosphate adenylyltransferase